MHVFYEYIQDFLAPGIWTTNIQYGVLTLVFATLLTLVLLQKKKKLKTILLPNKKRFYSFQKGETEFLYDEIWKDNTYLRNGIILKENSTVFDVGANIGMFSTFCANHVSPSKIKYFRFEPIPVIHEICKANLDMHVNANGGKATCLQLGVSDKVGVATFDFHHNFSLWSTAMPDFNERRKDRLLTDLGAMTESFKSTGRGKWFFNCVPNCLVSFIARRFLGILNRSEKVKCQLTTISAIIDQYDVEKIDLLKVDVEGCEERVLNGIQDKDWEKIQQLTLEVENFATVKRLTSKLQKLGFTVSSQPSERIANPNVSSEVSHLWACR